ncbi:sulfide-dependent adenosine diphosphate thiazole synthase [Thermodesulfatator atlanticus]|uniref:sulfide-dependent adenosine diphosphate thiazole synthase n=1 Tax=Thermodesulfatator atlanticus TaxID=501497 RepID=UPI0003B74E79|nr:sulfide-dependent adenosine diphosphate thiazole synthase [Thermodesulfatator atlanticus]
MGLDEIKISRAIVERYFKKLTDYLEMDVAVVGAGPSGLMAAYKLATKGFKVAVFERRMSIGGGIWGGGMMFNEIVVQEEGARLLKEIGVRTEPWDDGTYYTADSVEVACLLAAKCLQAGAKIFNLIMVEDVMVRDNRVVGLVLNWSATEIAGLHVDPLAVRSKYVIEATGHETAVLRVMQEKLGAKLNTETGKIMGEKSMWAEVAESLTVNYTREVYPGVFVAGMAANATFGAYRMGPIFGGMLLSGERAAELIAEKLTNEK